MNTPDPTDTRPSILRSIADSIEPAFPEAADLLRGMARTMPAHDAEVANQARREALQEAAQQASMNFPGSTTISGVRLRDWLEMQADDDRADTPHA